MTTALLPSSPVDLRHACVNVQVRTFLQYGQLDPAARLGGERSLVRSVERGTRERPAICPLAVRVQAWREWCYV